MYVCVCNRVTDRQIEQAADEGVADFDELCSRLRVASCCGRCRDCAHRVLNDALNRQWGDDAALACA
jgi:bacterioferritin-associated ferredoxin